LRWVLLATHYSPLTPLGRLLEPEHHRDQHPGLDWRRAAPRGHEAPAPDRIQCRCIEPGCAACFLDLHAPGQAIDAYQYLERHRSLFARPSRRKRITRGGILQIGCAKTHGRRRSVCNLDRCGRPGRGDCPGAFPRGRHCHFRRWLGQRHYGGRRGDRRWVENGFRHHPRFRLPTKDGYRDFRWQRPCHRRRAGPSDRLRRNRRGLHEDDFQHRCRSRCLLERKCRPRCDDGCVHGRARRKECSQRKWRAPPDLPPGRELAHDAPSRRRKTGTGITRTAEGNDQYNAKPRGHVALPGTGYAGAILRR